MQEQETLDHLLIQCAHERAVWYDALQPLGWKRFTPTHANTLHSWWTRVSAATPSQLRHRVNACVILIMHTLWKERNRRVFEDAYLATNDMRNLIMQEWKVWN